MTERKDVVTLTDAARFEKVGRTAIYARIARKELTSDMIAGTPHVRVESMTPAARKRYAEAQKKKQDAR